MDRAADPVGYAHMQDVGRVGGIAAANDTIPVAAPDASGDEATERHGRMIATLLHAIDVSMAALHQPESGNDLHDMVRDVIAVRQAKGWLDDWLRGAEEVLGEIIGTDGELVEGVGLVQGQWRTPYFRYTDKPALVHKVADLARDRRTVTRDGEVESEAEAVERVLVEAFDVTPRKTVLRKLDVDPDEWGEVSGTGRWTLRVVAEQNTNEEATR